MSRTLHHSRKFGPNHRAAHRSDRRRYSGSRDAGEAPGWHVRLYDERPGRRADKMTLLAVAKGELDADAASYLRHGNRKPHTWWW